MPFTRTAYQKLTTAGFVVGAALLLGLGLMALLVIRRQEQAEQLVRHTYAVELAARRIAYDLRGCLGSARGFALAHTPGFTERFTAIVADLDAGLADLRALCADNPEQVARLQVLEPAVARVVAFARQTMALPPGTVPDGAAAQLVEDSRIAMNACRGLTDAFVREEELLMAQRLGTAAREQERIQALIWATCAAGLLVLALSHAAVRRQLTLLKRVEDDLEVTVEQRTAELAASNRDLETFGHSVAHDLRAPLRAIEGFAGMAGRRLAAGDPAKADGYLTQVRDQVARMDRLITDLLDFAKAGSQLTLQPQVELGPLVGAVWEDLAGERATHGSTAELAFDGALCTVSADPALLRQVFQNLLANAIKYSAQHPRSVITVRARRGPPPEPVPADPLPVIADHEVVVSVTDHGTGFDMAHYAKLFGMFQRLHADERHAGNGIGLAIVKRIIERHGGRIWATSAPGAGAVFSFTLPAGPLPPAPSQPLPCAT